MPSDVPSLVSITPGGFDNIWVLDPKTKRLEEMQPIDPSLESAATLVRACGSRFWFRKVPRDVMNDWIWVGYDAAQHKHARFGAKPFETQSLNGPVMWAMAMGALS